MSLVTKGENLGLYLSGQQIKIPECNIFITQPKINDILYLPLSILVLDKYLFK